MKTTLTTSQAAQILVDDENANWTRAGAYALAEYLEDLEEDTGEQIEFCRVSLRCDYSEHENLVAWADDYFGTDRDGKGWKYQLSVDEDMDEDEVDDLIREHIQDHGILIEFDDGVIVSSF